MDSIKKTENNFVPNSSTTKIENLVEGEVQGGPRAISPYEKKLSVTIPPEWKSWFERDLDLPLDRPSDYDYALMSKAVYASGKDHENNNVSLPDGWTIFSYSEDSDNDYFGAAYQNKEMQHIVIAHRGSNLTKLKVWKTDIQGIGLNVVTDQQASAYAFSKKIKNQIKENNYNYSISHTGHSLGGWLAGVYAWHGMVSAVVFESPGFRNMIEELKKAKPKELNEEDLDIIIYLAIPNIVNSWNDHVGIRYRLFPEDNLQNLTSNLTKTIYEKAKRKLIPIDLQNLSQHLIDGLIASFEFDQETNSFLPKKQDIVYSYPTGFSDYKYFCQNLPQELRNLESKELHSRLEDKKRHLLEHRAKYVVKPFNKQELPLANFAPNIGVFLAKHNIYREELSKEIDTEEETVFLKNLLSHYRIESKKFVSRFGSRAEIKYRKILVVTTQNTTALQFRQAITYLLTKRHPEIYQRLVNLMDGASGDNFVDS